MKNNFKILFLRIFTSFVVITLSVCVSSTPVNANVEANATLIYDQCNKFMQRDQIDIIQEFGDNICVFIENDNGDLILLSKKTNSYGVTLMNPDLVSTLRKIYYRGEKVNIHLNGNIAQLNNTIQIELKKISYTAQTLEKGYTIEFFEDSLLDKNTYPTLELFCTFISYNSTCNNTQIKQIVDQIDALLSDLVISKQELQKATQDTLKQEIRKLQNIAQKLGQLKEKYSANDMLLFMLEYIIYKIEVNEKIMNNALEDLEFYVFLKENNIYFKDKSLLPDLYISQTDKFTFFYYKDTRINTLNTDLSHFDASEISADEKLEEDREYLKKEIRDKYSAKYIEGTNKELILMTKTYSNFNKYLLFDTKSVKLHTIDGDITQVEKGTKGYYFLTTKLDGEQHFIVYDGKDRYNLLEEITGYTIDSFELLVGSEIQINYTTQDGKKGEEIINVSNF